MDSYNDALEEQMKKNLWDTLKSEAKSMSALEYATVTADIAGIFDPTPVSDSVGMALSLAQGDLFGVFLSGVSLAVPYLGDALAKPAKIAKYAPKTAVVLTKVLKASDNLASSGKAALQKAGLSLEQVAKARQQALEKVQKAMMDVKQKLVGCEECRLIGPKGEKRTLQMPATDASYGSWKTPDGSQPIDGNGTFEFTETRTLPDGREVEGIEFKNGAPDFDKYVEGDKYDLWEVSGNADTDATSLRKMMREKDPDWTPPDHDDYVLHHFENGQVGYVPRTIHDRPELGAAHTGGNSMINNDLF